MYSISQRFVCAFQDVLRIPQKFVCAFHDSTLFYYHIMYCTIFCGELFPDATVKLSRIFTDG